VVYSHRWGFSLFKLGAPASKELYPLAEDGDATALVEKLTTSPLVLDYVSADGPVLPGQSVTLKIKANYPFRYLTAAGMLVSTNDAFFALQRWRVPKRSAKQATVPAYDSGSEANSEMCAYIPGPPCGNGGVRDKTGAEGYVHIHSGIHGGGDLLPAEKDWRNPVAAFVVKPVKY
jgi:hypothetical protein